MRLLRPCVCRPAAVPDSRPRARSKLLQQHTAGSTGSDFDGGGGDVDVDFLDFLSSNGLQHYVGTFTKHAIDMEALKVLEESHLAEMVRRRAPAPAAAASSRFANLWPPAQGIPIGARMKILAAARG